MIGSQLCLDFDLNPPKCTSLFRQVSDRFAGSVGLLTIVTPDKGISVRPPLYAIDVLLRLLQGNVHVSIDRLKLS
jgi:hypothetical protein